MSRVVMSDEEIKSSQHALMKAMLAKAGGELVITKDEYKAAQDKRFECLFDGKTVTVRLVETKLSRMREGESA